MAEYVEFNANIVMEKLWTISCINEVIFHILSQLMGKILDADCGLGINLLLATITSTSVHVLPQRALKQENQCL